VNGRLYAFLSIDPWNSIHAKLVIVDLGDPSNPQQVYSKVAGNPFVHDTFLRDGLLFVALWMTAWRSGTLGAVAPARRRRRPECLATFTRSAGQVHNVWWLHDATGGKRFAFVGQEGPGSIGSSSTGDIHVVDISDPTAPKEVAFYHGRWCGDAQFLRRRGQRGAVCRLLQRRRPALDVRGDLKTCLPSQTQFTSTGTSRDVISGSWDGKSASVSWN
jgi:hypothetical protein